MSGHWCGDPLSTELSMPQPGPLQQVGEGDFGLCVAKLGRVFGRGGHGIATAATAATAALDRPRLEALVPVLASFLLLLLHKVKLVVDVVLVFHHADVDGPEPGLALEDVLREEGEVVVNRAG